MMARQTKAQKRVALAKDVLAQLKAKKIEAGYGYFSPGYTHDDGETEACSVCALGAMMVACCGAPKTSQTRQQVVSCLVPLFSKPELALIEAAFEGGLQVLVPGVSNEVIYAHETKYHGVDREERLPKIMCNIIRNGGEFRA